MADLDPAEPEQGAVEPGSPSLSVATPPADAAGSRQAAGAAIDRLCRVQADFPVPGVLFRDLTPVCADRDALRAIALALGTAAGPVELVAGLESRGFLLAAAAGLAIGTGVLAVRKAGKLAGAVLTEEYQLEYGSAALQLNPSDVPIGTRILVIDDVLATGGTAAAAVRLLRRAGAEVAGVAVAIELLDLHGRDALPGVPVLALRSY